MTVSQIPEAPAARDPAHDDLDTAVPFLVVGVGASAGGLEAFIELLERLPPKPGISFLFVQHLEPTHKSQLAEIIGRITRLRVQEAEDGMAVENNNVYILPPNKTLTVVDGHLHLSPRLPRVPNMPADHLFRSLAAVQKAKAIGVILSGGGTDGTLGFQSIKAEGGITFVQDEKTARQDSMPRSAFVDGNVDYVLPPQGIAEKLAQLANHSYTNGPSASAELEPAEAFNQIIALLRKKTDVDFTHYKRTTIKRRIQRRMALRSVERTDQYLGILREQPLEVHQLFTDLLIRVTQFFRDPEAFDALKQKVLPALIDGRATEQPIRVWVAGCATGEEVYSLAISLLEFFAERSIAPSIKILATDLSETALEKARAGVYIDNIEIDVSPERLRQFFVRENSHYHISKTVRDLCIFSRHNIATDPPFSHLDLVSCRNVLIYMDRPLQKRVLPVFHYALKLNGFLFLGSSESLGSHEELFAPVDAKNRLFRKRGAALTAPVAFGGAVEHDDSGSRIVRNEPAIVWSALDVQREADRIVLTRFAPVGVIVDETMTVIQFRGRTSAYLEPAPGMASLDFMRMLREGLLAQVRNVMQQAKTENISVLSRPITYREGTETRLVKVEVIPFKAPPASSRFFLVLFVDGAAATSQAVTHVAPEPRETPNEQQVARLQQELAAIREYLQSVIEEQESTNEELKSANEEILSANEELQSTNEELQTAKEEAQSANEELATVNEELNHRNVELARVNNDLVNLLTGVNIPIVMVSRELRIRRFTPMSEKVFNLIPTDMGRPISDIKPNLQIDDLGALIVKVIDSLAPYESEVQARDGHWYSLRIRPYVTLDNKIDGASIVLLDIDSIKQALEQLKTTASETGDGEAKAQVAGIVPKMGGPL